MITRHVGEHRFLKEMRPTVTPLLRMNTPADATSPQCSGLISSRASRNS